MKRISIVVPAYNVAPYIERCLDSCMDQDIPAEEYEIIVVNDGSTDNTLAIARKYASTHPSVRLFSQENKGLSQARNAGMDMAEGEYLWFVDSDDAIAPGCLGSLCRECVDKDLDVLCFCRGRVEDGKTTVVPFYGKELAGKVVTGPRMLRDNLLKSVCSPFYVYRRKYLTDNGFRFAPGLLHEDEAWTPRVIYQAARVSFTDSVCYYAYTRSGSIMQTPNPKRSFDLITIAGQLEDYSRSVPAEDRYLFSGRISEVLNAALKATRGYPSEVQRQIRLVLKRNRHLFRHMRRSRIPKFQLAGTVLSLFPGCAVSLYKLLR
ncbi:MAG: glycosyltransferase [Bacteroidales bacterium]|nr:glycosyltransferase [Bacteroidales bacterium]